jgi:hypothetical protein
MVGTSASVRNVPDPSQQLVLKDVNGIRAPDVKAAASGAGAEDQPARERLLRYVLRPRFAARQ